MPNEKTQNPFSLSADREKQEETMIFPATSSDEDEIVLTAMEQFNRFRDNRDRVFGILDDQTLPEYWEESNIRYTTSVYLREDIEDWQSQAHVPVTRNKINNISGRAIQNLPIGQVMPAGTGQHRRATILNNLYEFSEGTYDYQLLMADLITEALVKGTAVCFEGHKRDVKVIRKVKNGKETSTTKIKNKLITKIVPIENFYPSSVNVRSIDELTAAIWREILPHDQFLMNYADFDRASTVPAFQHLPGEEPGSALRDYISSDVGVGNVEVLHIYRRDTDEYMIMANGVWLNPVGDTIIISPLPFEHKELPFNLFKFEPLAPDYLYGKSMPDKLRESQDMLDVMTNMIFDQSIMSIFQPIIMSSDIGFEDDVLRPGRQISVDTNGESVGSVVQPLNLSTPTGWHQFALNYVKGIMEEASVDQVSGGTAGVGERTTAKEIETAAAGVVSTLSYFGVQISEFVRRKVVLRVPNIMQVYFDKKNPVIQRITGENNEFTNSAFNTFALENAQLAPGKDGKIRRGKRIIEVYKSKEDFPTQEEQNIKSAKEQMQSGKAVEIVAVESEWIREMFDFDVRAVADKRIAKTQATEQAVAGFKAQQYMALAPDLVNREEVMADLMEANGDDPSRLLLSFDEQDPSLNPANPEAGGAPGAGGAQVGAANPQQQLT